MPFPEPKKAKALDKYVNDYKSGKLTKEQLHEWWEEGGLPYDKHFVGWILMKATPIDGFEHITQFESLNFFYKINKLMNAGFMSEYDKIGIKWQSDEMFDVMRKISSICIEKENQMKKGIFKEGEVEYLKNLPDWVDATQEDYAKLYYEAPYFKKEIKTVEDFLCVNWITEN